MFFIQRFCSFYLEQILNITT